MNTGFGISKARTFFNIKDGKIIVRDQETNQNASYDFFAGYLNSIIYGEKQVNFGGREQLFRFYNVSFRDTEDNIYIWSPAPNSFLFQNFINSICSLDTLQNVLIQLQPYMKGGQQRLSISYSIQQNYQNAPQKFEKLRWKYDYKELPPVLPVVGKKGEPMKDPSGHIIYDYEDRLAWIAERVKEINEKLAENEENGANIEDEGNEENGLTTNDIEDVLKDLPF